MFKYFVIFIFLFISSYGVAQKNVKDSLIERLEKHSNQDEERVDLLRDYGNLLLNDSMYKELNDVGDEIISIPQKIDYQEGMIYGHITKARYFELGGQFKKAVAKFHAIIKLAKTYGDSVLLYDAYRYLGLYYDRNSESDSTIFYLKKAFYAINNSRPESAVITLSQIAVGYYHQSMFDSAIRYARIGYNIIERDDIQEGALPVANILAAALKRKGAVDSALYYFKKALEYAKKDEDKFAALQVYNNMANIYGDRGNYHKALEYYLLTLKAAEEAKLDMAMAVTYNNIAIIYYTLEEYQPTIEYLEKSYAISKRTNDLDNTINTLNNLGEIYLKIDSVNVALEKYNESAALLDKVDNIGYRVHNSRGKAIVFERFGKKDSALIYHKKALEYARGIGSKYELVQSNSGIANFYLKEKQYKKAAHYAQTAFDLSSELSFIEGIRSAAEILHKANAELVRLKDAYHYLKVFTEMNDSMLNQDNTREITQLEMEYKHDKEMQEREVQEAIRELQRQKEITKQKGLRNAFIVAFILVLLIIVIVVRSIKQKQKANQQLAYQKAEIEEKNEELQQLMSEVSRQKDEIELSHNQIKGSIRYAERIQNALLPLEEDLSELFADHFVFYKPLEIVSGDFYWVEKVHNNILIAAGDCTGHGVPGAMLSMLGISYLNDIARQPNIVVASQVLEKMRKRVKRSLHQTGDVRETRDGMDIAFAAINIEDQTLDFAGANNPIIVFRNEEMIELVPDKQPISVFQKEEPFSNQLIKLEKGDVIYLFTDGYMDQFNGKTNKKFGSKQFKEVLGKIHNQPMLNQKQILKRELENWMEGGVVQIDDILVAGFKWK